MSATKASGRKRKATNEIDEARPTTRAATRRLENERRAAARCIWRLPQEIRDTIYGYVLSTPNTKSPPQALHNPTKKVKDGSRALKASVAILVEKEDALKKLKQTAARKAKLKNVHVQLERAHSILAEYPTPLQLDLMRTNKQVCEEVTKYIKERVLLSFIFDGSHIGLPNAKSLPWSQENKTWLLRAQHIFIRYHLHHQHQHRPLSAMTVTSKEALECRTDIKTFEFRGCGVQVLEDRRFEEVDGVWKSTDTWSAHLAMGWGQSCDAQLCGQIMQVLRGLPRVKASKKKRVTWLGDEQFPAEIDDKEVNEYQEVVKELEL
jgi:hypothetical protein